MKIPFLPPPSQITMQHAPSGKAEGKSSQQRGQGRDDWEGAGGNVRQDPGRVLLRFSPKWRKVRRRRTLLQDCVWQEEAQEQVRCRTLWKVPGGARAHSGTSQMQRSSSRCLETQICWNTFHVEESCADGGVSWDTCTGALQTQKIGAPKMGSEVRDSWERR